MRALLSFLLLAGATGSALAVECGPSTGIQCLPEPGSLALLGIAAAAGAFVTWRGRNKK